MIQKVARLYNPEVDFTKRGFWMLPIADFETDKGYPHFMNKVLVDTTKPFRKIWTWFHTSATPFVIDFDLVAGLGGNEVFRHKIHRNSNSWSTGNGYWLGNLNNQGPLQPLGSERVKFWFGAQVYDTAPFDINITADSFWLDLREISGGVFWYSMLMVKSQRSI